MKKADCSFFRAALAGAVALAALFMGGCDLLTGFANGDYDGFTGIFTTPVITDALPEGARPVAVDASDPQSLEDAILAVAGDPDKAAALLGVFADEFKNAPHGSDEARNLAAAAISLSIEAGGLMNVLMEGTGAFEALVGGGDIEEALGSLLSSLSDIPTENVSGPFLAMLTEQEDGSITTKVTTEYLDDLIKSGASPDNVAIAGITMLIPLLKDGDGNMINPLDPNAGEALTEKFINSDEFGLVGLCTAILGGESDVEVPEELESHIPQIKTDFLEALFHDEPVGGWVDLATDDRFTDCGPGVEEYLAELGTVPPALADAIDSSLREDGSGAGLSEALQSVVLEQFTGILSNAATAATDASATQEQKAESVEALAGVLSAVPDAALPADTKVGLVLVLASANMGNGGMIGSSLGPALGGLGLGAALGGN